MLGFLKNKYIVRYIQTRTNEETACVFHLSGGGRTFFPLTARIQQVPLLMALPDVPEVDDDATPTQPVTPLIYAITAEEFLRNVAHLARGADANASFVMSLGRARDAQLAMPRELIEEITEQASDYGLWLVAHDNWEFLFIKTSHRRAAS